MARGRGRGRMRFRARPPPSVRQSMQELGLGAGANYGGVVADAMGAQVDAARAYFPALEGGAAPALRPTEKELELVARFEKIRAVLRASPAAVRARGARKPALVGELSRARAFFCAWDADEKPQRRESLWAASRPWFVPELLPPELRRAADAPPRTAPKTDAEPAIGALDVGAARSAPEADHDDPDRPDKDAEEPGAAAASEEDDLELNADYETGAHFDDDDGYEEADSGNDEAIF